MSRYTPDQIQSRKGGDRIVCLTAYTAPMAKALDPHVDLTLVGDSVGMVLYGLENTLGVTIEMMIAHGAAVVRGADRACVVVDMPFGTYEECPALAAENARYIIDKTGCDAVKLEGGVAMVPQIRAIVAAGVPVMGHIGLQPQSVVREGGYKIKGRGDAEIARLVADAQAVTEAGVFSIVVEGTVPAAAEAITQAVSIPTIGIGASAACDGQILVTEDMLGLGHGHVPKFVKGYAVLGADIDAAVRAYADEVRSGAFPAKEHTYS